MDEIIITVERNDDFFNEKFREEHSKLILSTNNIRAGQVNEFKFSDIKFINPSEKSLDSLPAFEKEIIKKGYVPLDIYQANAILEKIMEDYKLACILAPDLPFTNIVFLGSTIRKEGQKSEINNYPFFEYDYFDSDRIPRFTCSHRNEGTITLECLAAVFKKSFFEQEKQAENTNLKKRTAGKMPTLEQCQAAVIKRLQKDKAELKKKFDELQEKYNQEILNISKPKLNPEVEEFLCKKISGLKLSNRTKNALDAREVIYLFQLAEHTTRDLNMIRNLGENSVEEIKNFLNSHALSLGTKFSQKEIEYFWKKLETI